MVFKGRASFGLMVVVLCLSACGKAPSEGQTSKAVESKADEPKAEVTAADLPSAADTQSAPTGGTPAPHASAKAKATEPAPSNVEPTTATAALAVISFDDFPKLEVKQLLEAGPFSTTYSAQGNLKNADEFLSGELKKAGWKDAQSLATSTEQYIDRSMIKNGYNLRYNVSTGSAADEVMVTMQMLGNFDMRTLPRTKDAEAGESTPTMAGLRTAQGMAEAYDDLTKRMSDAGWQLVEPFTPSAADSPTYRSAHFRKNAQRVNLGLVQDPSQPNKVAVFYHAESAIPIDLPMLDHQQPLKFDPIQNHALIPWKGDRAGMVELLKKEAPKFGWQLVNADDFVGEKITVLYISVGSPIGIAARYIESAGKYYISMDRVKLPEAKQ